MYVGTVGESILFILKDSVSGEYIDIEGGQATLIVVKPNGDVVAWDVVIGDPGHFSYVLMSGDVEEVGNYKVQLKYFDADGSGPKFSSEGSFVVRPTLERT